MDINEAIRILDPETTSEALAEIEYYNGFSGHFAKVEACDEACEIAVAVMRAQQAAEKNDPLTLDELRDDDHVHAAGACYCKECKHWHENTGFCEENSYFVDAAGDCCSPADSREWTMFDANDFCSRGERRNNDG